MERENLKEDSNFAVVFSAPTGYGKSSCTMALAKFIAEKGYFAERLIHVLPLRAIVSDLYRKASSRLKNLGVSIGAQAMHLLDANKTPFFMPRLVYTTFDSFVHNLFKAPVAERDVTRSHFDVPRYSIYSSLVVFDEAHLFSAESPVSEREEFARSQSRMFTAFCAVLESLSGSLAPMVVMTATMPSRLLDFILVQLKNPYYATEKRIYLLEYNPELDDGEVRERKVELQGKPVFRLEVGDQRFLEEAEKLNPRFKGIVKQEDVCKKILEEVRNGARVLVVRNTVRDAVETFRFLNGKGEDAVLIHGRLSVEDRWAALSYAEQRLETGKPFALVATQVVEAGVDLDLDVLITDAAPLNALIQRVGRVGRRLKTKRAVEPSVYVVEGEGSQVYDPYLTQKTLELLKTLEKREWKMMWRVPKAKGMQGYLGYTEALDTVYASWDYRLDEELKRALLDIDRYYMLDQAHIKNLLDRLCSFVREEGMFQLSHWVEEVSPKGYTGLRSKSEDAWSRAYGSLVPISVKVLAGRWRDILAIENDQVKVLAISSDERVEVATSKALYEALEEAGSLYHMRCRFLRKIGESLSREFRKKKLIALAPILKPGVYVRREGLRLD